MWWTPDMRDVLTAVGSGYLLSTSSLGRHRGPAVFVVSPFQCLLSKRDLCTCAPRTQTVRWSPSRSSRAAWPRRPPRRGPIGQLALTVANPRGDPFGDAQAADAGLDHGSSFLSSGRDRARLSWSARLSLWIVAPALMACLAWR
jgi:hypothetical protein